jgi:hypothetical protein
MLAADTYLIRRATSEDERALRELAELDTARPLPPGEALIGEIDGRPAAAISITDGRVVADPFRVTAHLTPLLHLRVRSLKAYERTPSLSERLIAAVRGSRASVARA